MSHLSHYEAQALSPYDMEYFDSLSGQVSQMYISHKKAISKSNISTIFSRRDKKSSPSPWKSTKSNLFLKKVPAKVA